MTTPLVLGLIVAVALLAVATIALLVDRFSSHPPSLEAQRQIYDAIYVGYPSEKVLKALGGTFRYGSPYMIGVNYRTNTVKLVDTGFVVKAQAHEDLGQKMQTGQYVDMETQLIGHNVPHHVRFIPHADIATATLEVGPHLYGTSLRVDLKLLEMDDMHKLLVALREV